MPLGWNSTILPKPVFNSLGVVFYRNMGPKACHDFLGLFLILTTVFGVIGVKRRKKVNFGSGFVISENLIQMGGKMAELESWGYRCEKEKNFNFGSSSMISIQS